jgi:hypothetical protein
LEKTLIAKTVLEEHANVSLKMNQITWHLWENKFYYKLNNAIQIPPADGAECYTLMIKGFEIHQTLPLKYIYIFIWKVKIEHSIKVT